MDVASVIQGPQHRHEIPRRYDDRPLDSAIIFAAYGMNAPRRRRSRAAHTAGRHCAISLVVSIAAGGLASRQEEDVPSSRIAGVC